MRGRIVLLLLMFPSVLSAQSLPLAPGARVRVLTASNGSSEGLLVGLTNDSLVLRHGGSEVGLSRGQIEEMQVFTGVTRYTLPGLFIGALGGMLVGFHVGGLGKDEGLDPSGIICTSDKECGQFSGLVVGMGVGFLVGGIVGYNIKTDRWRSIPLPERMSAILNVPPHGGMRIGMRLAL